MKALSGPFNDMMQKGTGERFKYKKAVLYFHSKAICIKSPAGGYYVFDSEYNRRISGYYKRAEDAWANAYEPLRIKHELILLYNRLDNCKEDSVIKDVRRIVLQTIQSL